MSQEPGKSESTTATLPAVPATWPGAFGIYKYSKQAVLRNWQTLLVLAIISALLSSVPYSVHGGVHTLLMIVTNILALMISISAIKTGLQSIRGERVSLETALHYSFDASLLVNYFVSSLVVGLLLFASFLLFIVPFFFVLPRVMLAPYYLIDKNMGPIEAIRASWDASKGHSGKLWGIIGATIAMALLFLTIIGIPFALYFLFMYSVAQAIAYLFVAKQHDSGAAPIAGTPVPPTATV